MHSIVQFSLTVPNYTTKKQKRKKPTTPKYILVTISRAIHPVIAFSSVIDQSALMHCNISGAHLPIDDPPSWSSLHLILHQSSIGCMRGEEFLFIWETGRSVSAEKRHLYREVSILSACFLFLFSFWCELVIMNRLYS